MAPKNRQQAPHGNRQTSEIFLPIPTSTSEKLLVAHGGIIYEWSVGHAFGFLFF
jgi:hypothetical protein